MPSTPPRRTRRSAKNDRGLPVVPLLIAVVVIGFAIGAGLSFLRRGSAPALPAGTPAPAATETPQPATESPVTPAPTERPTKVPTPAPTAVPTKTPVSSPAPTAPPSPSTAPAAEPTDASDATASEAPAAGSEASGAPESGAGAEATATPALPPFTALAEAVVRQYLVAVERGEPMAAYAALGTTAGDRRVSLKEAGLVSRSTRIGRMEASTAANGDVYLTVPLRTSNGPYVATYTVHRSDSGAAIITDHAISKV